jgi:Mor family transcriptional regulator
MPQDLANQTLDLPKMGYRPRLTAKRNRAILSAFETGNSLTQISKSYGLTVVTVREIIRQESHRRALSLEAYYRQLRKD